MSEAPRIDPSLQAALDAAGVSPTPEELVMFSVILPVLRERTKPIYTVDLSYEQI